MILPHTPAPCCLQALPTEPSSLVTGGLLRSIGTLLRRLGDDAAALVITLGLDEHVRALPMSLLQQQRGGASSSEAASNAVATASAVALASEVLVLLDRAIAAAAKS
jgi:hypothetical protein